MQTLAPQRQTSIEQSLSYCVISHTHWDREWYQPFEEFRLRLVDLIDHVLDILDQTPAYTFHLDAQTIVLDDYLEIRPWRRDELTNYIKTGRLLVGPWYVQNDFYLTSGEATLRNLLIGSAHAAAFGRCSQTGYVPDQFGLIGQLPQIFNGFGISDCLFGRGYTHYEKNAAGQLTCKPLNLEFEWRGEDGSAVLAIHMSSWYNNAQRFPPERARALKYLGIIERQIKPRATTPYLLLMNGVDHLEAQEDLLPILDEINSSISDNGSRIYQTTMHDYIAKVREYLAGRAIDSHTGELRSGPDGSILQGTLSSRAYLKRENVRAQVLIENQLEPLHVMLGLLTGPAAYPADMLRHLWKELIQNHPHDSICGCSCDPVHASMEERFARIQTAGQDLLRRGLAYLSRRIDRSRLHPDAYLLTLCNTLKSARAAAVTATLQFPDTEGIERFELRDPAGVVVPFEIVQSRLKMISLISPINLPGQMRVREVTIRFVPEPLAGLAYRHYTIEAVRKGGQSARRQPARPSKTGETAVLENEQLQVVVHKTGKVDLLDKRTGRWTRDLLRLEDEADLGHSYNFEREPEARPVVVSEWPARVQCLEATPLAQRVRITYVGKLSDHYDRRRQRRSTQRQTNRIDLTLSLTQGAAWFEIEAEIDNRSRDHRLRLLFQTDIATEDSLSAVPFDVLRRDRREILNGANQDGSQPNSGLVCVRDAERSLAVFNEGLFEFEHLMDARHSLAMTLLRATGTIHHSAVGLIDASEAQLEPPREWLAPGNQCLRPTRFRLGVMPGGAAAAELDGLPDRCLEFLSPVLVHFDAVEARKFLGGRPCVQDGDVDGIFYRDLPPEEGSLPLAAQPLRISGDGVVLSALKRAEQGERWVLRLYNPWPEPRTAEIVFPQQIRHACRLRLDEQILEPLETPDGRLRLTLGAKQICTVGFA